MTIAHYKEIKAAMKFAGVKLTEETILKTRIWFHDNSLACIEEVRSGMVRVNDSESYFRWREEEARNAIDGKIDHTLTFLQRAHFIQTGECVALLP